MVCHLFPVPASNISGVLPSHVPLWGVWNRNTQECEYFSAAL